MSKYINKILCMDVIEGLSIIPDDLVCLTCTSPPYNVGINYQNRDDNQSYDEYLEWLNRVFAEIFRITKIGGRCVINIDAMTNRQEDKDQEYVRCIYAHLYNIMKEIGWKFRTEICWYKQNAVGKQTAWGCYDEQTRVMTRNGLKFFKDIDINRDEFATLNLKTEELEYQKANNFFEYDYSGKMIQFKSSDYDLLVTPNHNVLYRNNYNKKLEIKTAENIQKSFMIPQGHSGFKEGIEQEYFILPKIEYGRNSANIYKNKIDKLDMDDWLRFLGIFLTDGSVYYSSSNRVYNVSIYQKKLKYINCLLKKFPFTFKYKESKSEYYTCSKQLAEYLHVNCGCKNERAIPVFIKNLSVRQKKILIKWLFIGDGHRGKQQSFATVSENMIKDLIPLLLECNYKFSVRKRKIGNNNRYLNGHLIKNNKKYIYIINIKKAKNSYIRKANTQEIDYNGKIYCVTVENHILFVERNGCFSWSGNSFCSASNPVIRRNHEYVLVWSKGDWKLEGDSELSDMTKKEFNDFTFSTWFISPETKKPGNHPAPFPEQLVYRLIKLFSYRDDIILDPFNGSGTTTAVAASLCRKWIGIDNSTKYVDFAIKRTNLEYSKCVQLEIINPYIKRSERLKK